jgi:hypothetical protein
VRACGWALVGPTLLLLLLLQCVLISDGRRAGSGCPQPGCSVIEVRRLRLITRAEGLFQHGSAYGSSAQLDRTALLCTLISCRCCVSAVF